MTALNFILFFCLNIFLLISDTKSLLDLKTNSNKERIVRITAPIRGIVEVSYVFTPQFDDLCIGTSPQCFPVTLSIYERHTSILNNSIADYAISPVYNSSISSTFKSEKTLLIAVDTVFGRANYFNANETIRINPSVNTKIANDNVVHLYDFNFRAINKISKPSRFVSNGVVGLGHKSEFLSQLKNNSLIDKMIYSVELTDDRNSLEISIGGMSTKLKELDSQNNITYCNIISSDFYAMEYWGCNADLFLRPKHKMNSLYSETVLFYEILGEEKDDMPVIYFVKNPDLYQTFILDGMLDNNPNCPLNITIGMFQCDSELDVKSLPNLLMVMNNVTYVFKPENLFYWDDYIGRLVLRIKFIDEGSINHIKLSQHFLLSQNISMVYDMEKNQVGFNGFNTHKYRGDSDDGNDEPEKSHYILIFAVVMAIIVIFGIGYVIYRNINKRRNNVPSGYLMQ